MKRIYITTPIYYVNDIPHIGHAYTSYAADTLARYKKYCGNEVFFLTGTDEHGQKVEDSAKLNGVTPEEYTNKIAKKFIELTKTLNLTNNDFIRTSNTEHKQYVRKIWEKLFHKGDIYLGNYKGWYSIRDECFVAENEIICPEAVYGSLTNRLMPNLAPIGNSPIIPLRKVNPLAKTEVTTVILNIPTQIHAVSSKSLVYK